jgi:aerobic-type carbon monoxide dehydrogenase small subunit (CoxS/CutS family)
MIEISFELNGSAERVAVAVDETLLSVLRERLGYTGTKDGCGIGVCGACTVLVDGRMVSSCLQLAVLSDGVRVTTIEGVGAAGALDPLQEAFLEHGGLQCGACTPGQVLAGKALLAECPRPSRDEVVEWMTGNLCRCTGYEQIVRAVLAAASAQ